MSIEKALANGLTHRPLGVSAGDTLSWYGRTVGVTDGAWMDGLVPDRGLRPDAEAALLGAYRPS